MRESVIYQDILQQGESSIVLRLLTRRLEAIPDEIRLRIQTLSSEKLENLAEAWLDFSGLSELLDWLQRQQETIDPYQI